MKISKPKLNFIIDIIMFTIMMPIAGIGFLIKYTLIAGYKRNTTYGKNVDLQFLGFDRHQWGTIHLILSLALLFLLLLHIVFHWKQIVIIYKSLIHKKSWRYVLSSAILTLSIVLIAVPLLVNPNISNKIELTDFTTKKSNKQSQKLANQYNWSSNKCYDSKYQHHNHQNHGKINISGKMTLREVADQYNIPPEKLASAMHIPVSQSNVRLGRLKKKYSFQLHDLRNVIKTNEIRSK